MLIDMLRETRSTESGLNGEAVLAESNPVLDLRGLETIKTLYHRYSFTLAFVLIAVAILSIGGFVVQDLRHASQGAEQMYASSLRGLRLIGELQYQTQEARRGLLYALTSTDPKLQVDYAEQACSSDQKVTEMINEHLRLSRSAREVDAGSLFERDWFQYLKIRDEVIESIRDGRVKEAVDHDSRDGVPAFNLVGNDLDALKRLYKQQADNQLAQGESLSRRSLLRLTVILFLTLLSAGLAIKQLQKGQMLRVLQRSEARLREVIESINEGMFVIGRDGRVELWNSAAERSSGRVRQQVLGYSLHEAIPELASTELPSAITEAMQANRSIVLQDLRYVANGHERTFEARVFPFEGSATVFFNDVTERQVLQDQLIQAQKMESIGRLAGGVAHDFNNLLTVISGYSELLLSRLGAGHPVRGHVTEIQRAADRAASLTRQLLAFSRQQVLEPQVLDLKVVIANTEKMLRRLIGEDIELVTTAGTELGRVRADAGQMEQVIMNLAVNARDAMPRGGKLTIETANVEFDEAYARSHVGVNPGPHVMLAVTDTGTGMDSETQARIFEPFFTTKEKGKGTGLGLATVYGIVKQSGGNIDVYSNVGRGTTLKIYLPRVDEAVQPAKRPRARTEMPQGRETVLLVEDEESVRSLVQGILHSNGYTVLQASRSEDALGICERHKGPIHLLLADVVMPQMSGREIAERLISDRPEMKVLYMSGYTDDAVVRHGILDSNTAFLQKPFTPEALARKVRLVLDAS